MKLTPALGAVAAVLFMSAGAQAGEVQPAQPVPAKLYSGRWYEVARTPNMLERNCEAATTDFLNWNSGSFSAVRTCRQGAPDGPKQSISVRGEVLPASQNAKIRLAMLGGLVSQDYWILDHASDNAWLIMATPSDRYVWLMSRAPVLDAAARNAALSRLQALGFNLAKLDFPQHATP